MIITISGTPGSGKSTIAKELSKELNFKHYYIGMMRRKIAKKKGISLEELNKLGESDISTDIEVDNYQKELAKKENNIIIEGRTSFFFVPESLKVFIEVDINEGAKRIFNDLNDSKKKKQRNEGNAKTLNQTKQMISKRIKSDIKRYKKYYGIENAYDTRNFDLIINTTNLSKEQAMQKAITDIKKAMRNKAN